MTTLFSDKIAVAEQTGIIFALGRNGYFFNCNVESKATNYNCLLSAPKVNPNEIDNTSISLSNDGQIIAVAGSSLFLLNTQNGELIWTSTDKPNDSTHPYYEIESFFSSRARYYWPSWFHGKHRFVTAVELSLRNGTCYGVLHILRLDRELPKVIKWDKVAFKPQLDKNFAIMRNSFNQKSGIALFCSLDGWPSPEWPMNGTVLDDTVIND